MLVIPVASAEPERGFSHMGNIKTDWRSVLTTDNLNSLMTVKLSNCNLYSSNVICKAVELWYSQCKAPRRFVALHGTHNKKKSQDNDESDDDSIDS